MGGQSLPTHFFMRPDLEQDLSNSPTVLAKVKQSEIYAQNLYAALCNNVFQKSELWPVLQNQIWSCTWRYAGGIIADMRDEGDYIAWYCSGMGGMFGENADRMPFFVPEGTVTQAIAEDLAALGWQVVDTYTANL